jgi:tetratricopeptide (TPR) repeat protein
MDTVPAIIKGYSAVLFLGGSLLWSQNLLQPVWGFADLHTHPASFLGFGAVNGEDGLIWGKPQEFPVSSTTPLVSAEDVARVADYRGVSRAASDASISVARLSHKPMRRARAEFLRGLRFTRTDARQAAAAEFEKAVALDPKFSEAYGNLGVVYTRLGHFDEAVVAFQSALRLDPTTAAHHANLAFALIQLKRYDEAKNEAQTAIWLDPGNSSAEFFLGYTLALRPETLEFSESHLIIAAKLVPEAHLVLAEVYGIQGAIHLAQGEMELYRAATRKRPVR